MMDNPYESPKSERIRSIERIDIYAFLFACLGVIALYYMLADGYRLIVHWVQHGTFVDSTHLTSFHPWLHVAGGGLVFVVIFDVACCEYRRRRRSAETE